MPALLQSPHFVYRVEASSTAIGALILLSDFELATKLSYRLWNTMPDDALFAAAKSGKLATSEGVLAEATRLLDDDRARVMVASFHHQLFQYDHYDDLNKDPSLFPDFTPALGADIKQEAGMFIEEMVFAKNGGIKEILTEPTTFMNSELAAIYGLKGRSRALAVAGERSWPTSRTARWSWPSWRTSGCRRLRRRSRGREVPASTLRERQRLPQGPNARRRREGEGVPRGRSARGFEGLTG